MAKKPGSGVFKPGQAVKPGTISPGPLGGWITGNPVDADGGRQAFLDLLQGGANTDAAAQQTYDDGSGGSSGGGGGGDTYVTYADAAPPPPPPQLATSPEWLAFLNQLGLEENQFRGDITKQQGMARATTDLQAGDLAAQGQQSRRNIAGGLEGRGMARSGQFVRSLAEQRAGEGRQQGAIQNTLANTLSGLESNLAQKLLDLGTKRAQQELQLRSVGYV